MLVRDIMSERPVTVATRSSITAALRLLSARHVTAIPVVDDRDRIVGIVSEIDLIRGRIHPDPMWPGGSADGGQAPESVGEVMTRELVVVNPETDVYEVGQVLARLSVKSLPVVDAADRVVGMVSRSDVVQALTRDDEALQEDIADALVGEGLWHYRVEVRNGVAQVSAPHPAGDGAVAPDAAEVARVVEVVRATPGVSAVHTC